MANGQYAEYEILAGYDGAVTITITASEITDWGDYCFHAMANNWNNQIKNGARFDGLTSTFDVSADGVAKLRDGGFYIRPGMGFNIASITVEKK